MTGFSCDPSYPERPSGCQFLKQVGSLYLCEITDGPLKGDPKVRVGPAVKRNPQGKLLEVTQAQMDYWQRECRPFPNPLDPAHVPPRFTLPPECGIKIRWVD